MGHHRRAQNGSEFGGTHCALLAKLAPTHRATLMVTRHVGLVPLHQYPVQPVKVDPLLAAAVRVTVVPLA